MYTRRDDTDAERYDRNWSDLVQELRVAQTGVQVLAGFVLAAAGVLGFFVTARVVLPLSLLRRGTDAS